MDNRTEKAFLGKARHNLKNPVNAILGYSEMLIEDCEDEGLDHLIPDISKLNQAGSEILTSIEEIFNDKALSDPDKSISTIAEEMEMALRTPLNTIIGYSELLIEESESVDIDNFVSDINKISESGKMLEKELRSIIDFDSDDVKGIRKQNLNQGNLSMVKDVLESINPIDADDKKPKELGNILVVDDNKNKTDLLDKRLSKKGHNVVTANNGKEALLRLTMDRLGVDVILLDIVMPEMNGYELLKFIKNDKRFFEIPVIMISRYMSLASIIGASSALFVMCTLYIFNTAVIPGDIISIEHILYPAVGSQIIIIKHKENIIRLLKGTERKIGVSVATEK